MGYPNSSQIFFKITFSCNTRYTNWKNGHIWNELDHESGWRFHRSGFTLGHHQQQHCWFFSIIFLLAISFFFVCLFVCLGFFSPHFSVIFFLLASVPPEAIYPSCSLPHLQLSTKVHNICYAFLSCSGYHLKDMTISCIFRMPDIQHTHAFLLG